MTFKSPKSPGNEANTTIPKIGEKLSDAQIEFLSTLTTACRRDIIEMVTNAQSGHPGGSLSSMDYLALIYAYIIGQSGEKIVVSNGHISPAVYAILAEMGYIPREQVIKNFRKAGSPYEGHVTRHVKGIWYGTGPLGVGVSVAAAFALAEKMAATGQNTSAKTTAHAAAQTQTTTLAADAGITATGAKPTAAKKVFALMGDGEAQEGQVYEMMLFANKYKLNNLILFVDSNLLQLTASLEEIMPLNLKAQFKAAGWDVLECNGHDFGEMWNTIGKAYKVKNKPVVIIGNTIMGKGVDFMEKQWLEKKSTWHGNSPSKEQADEALSKLTLNPERQNLLKEFLKEIKWEPRHPAFTANLTKMEINPGEPILYDKDTLTDCRTAYGKALLSLAKLNPQIVALAADLRGSVMTKFLAEEFPDRHIECGIAEQNMVSIAGGLAVAGLIPFCSTFGAFMSSRAKDQARVNDINKTNVKMVSTHCGLSVGEDGPTHQAIDDTGSFLGMFNTMTIEPADPNHTDRIIRFIASHYGNFYVRMGRHKIPAILTEDGKIFYDEKYVYEYGKCDVLREGKDITIAATGSMITEALAARERLKISKPDLSVEIVAVSSIKKFDQTLINSVKKTRNLITVEDHNTFSGLGSQIARHLLKEGIKPDKFHTLGVSEYQLSGKPQELYALAGLNAEAIEKACVG
jgi:transketolase